MALTRPPLTGDGAQCSVSLQSIERNVTINITLTEAQTKAWSDQDLTDRVNALTTAVRAFLSPGESTQLDVGWLQYSRATITREYQMTEAPEPTPDTDQGQ